MSETTGRKPRQERKSSWRRGGSVSNQSGPGDGSGSVLWEVPSVPVQSEERLDDADNARGDAAQLELFPDVDV